MRFMEIIPDVEFKANLLKKLAPPLVTLLSSEPEVQYVALRNINLIVQKKPEILKHEIKAKDEHVFIRFEISSNSNVEYRKNYQALIY